MGDNNHKEVDQNTVSTQHDNDDDDDEDHDDGDHGAIGVVNGGDDDDDDEVIDLTTTPLLHYTRITSVGLPRRQSQQAQPTNVTTTTVRLGPGPFSPSSCSCSELTVIKIDPETLILNNSAAATAAFAAASNATASMTAATGSDNNNNNNINAGGGGGGTAATATTTTTTTTERSSGMDSIINNSLLLSSDLWRQPHPILACGWESNNTITLTHIHPNNSNSSSSSCSGEGYTSSSSSSSGGGAGNNVGTPVAIIDSNNSSSSSSSGHHHGGPAVGPIPVVNINSMMNLGGGGGGGGGGQPSSSSSTNTGGIGGVNLLNNDGQHGGSNVSSSTATLKLYVREAGASSDSHRHSSSRYSVVDMSFDASGTVLGAIDDHGACTIWEFKYCTTLQPKSLLFPRPSPPAAETGENNEQVTAGPAVANAQSQSHSAATPSSGPSHPSSSNRSGGTTNNPNVFSNFMSALTGMPPTASDAVVEGKTRSPPHVTTASDNHTSSITDTSLTPTLTASVVHVSRVNYPSSWGSPSCMVLDPSYKKKRGEKMVLVGFESGKLVLTKRGTFFQRRNDTVVYQSSSSTSAASSSDNNNNSSGATTYRGIETVVWRGSLVAWADANGIKLLDMDTMTRIAHIDRPTGARQTLYPTIRDLHPSLFFETSSQLLVAWGDCLMEMSVREHLVGNNNNNPTTASTSDGKELKKRRTVECTLAWELDCVACDIVPLDADHVVVLGLVPTNDEDEQKSNAAADAETNDNSTSKPQNDVEVQVLSRKDGTILYCDSLPLLRNNNDLEDDNSNTQRGMLSIDDSATSHRLLSTYALPRMDDVEETKAMKTEQGNVNGPVVGLDVDFDLNQGIFSGNDNTAMSNQQRSYQDPHLRWSLQKVLDNDISDDRDAGDASSVDSDDYDFVNRPLPMLDMISGRETDRMNGPPPTMIVCTGSDAVLSRVSTVDDSIQNAVTRGKFALALRRGLLHKRRLRRFKLQDLINMYLEAVLRLGIGSDLAGSNQPTLSLRRMKLALDAMPVLLGDDISLWEKWTRQLESIPGSLFLLQKNIPVRGMLCGVA
jgi:hypothetical protein